LSVSPRTLTVSPDPSPAPVQAAPVAAPLTIVGAAARLNLTYRNTRRLVAKGELVAVQVPISDKTTRLTWQVDEASLQRCVDARTSRKATAAAKTEQRRRGR